MRTDVVKDPVKQPQLDSAQAELSALREELDGASRSAETLHEVIARLKRERDVAVEQNTELCRLAKIAAPRLREAGSYTLATLFEAALNPTKPGSIS
jgi:hypothetical protein